MQELSQIFSEVWRPQALLRTSVRSSLWEANSMLYSRLADRATGVGVL